MILGPTICTPPIVLHTVVAKGDTLVRLLEAIDYDAGDCIPATHPPHVDAAERLTVPMV